MFLIYRWKNRWEITQQSQNNSQRARNRHYQLPQMWRWIMRWKKKADVKYIYEAIGLFPQSGLLGIFPIFWRWQKKVPKWKISGKNEVQGTSVKTGRPHGFVAHSGWWILFYSFPSAIGMLAVSLSSFKWNVMNLALINMALWNPVCPWGTNNTVTQEPGQI